MSKNSAVFGPLKLNGSKATLTRLSSADESIYFEPSSLGEKQLSYFEPLFIEIFVHFTKLMEAYQAE